ncbi:MAG: hypothetical protein HQK88_07895 [Nitrospirae bacterium]|nr:hypothetical protein [Nitrospirota bacterium]MBF0533625.1 hypothetical protein [Nitrospirota bacterium]MBF0616724.1 hypothetical protein [Nitrospirota bacterium]
MNEINKCHRQAMDYAEEAYVLKLKGEAWRAKELIEKAFSLEKKASELVRNTVIEPTRSVLHRSAASLAIECNKFSEAESLILFALFGNPPEEIAQELRDLLEQINPQKRHDLHAKILAPSKHHFSILGRAA